MSMKSRLWWSLYLVGTFLLYSQRKHLIPSSLSVSPSRSNRSYPLRRIGMIPRGYPLDGGIHGEMPDSWEGGEVIESEEPVLGFRAWRAVAFDGNACLVPVYSDYPIWPHYEKMVALCPHWLKHNTQDDPRLRPQGIGQLSQASRLRSILTAYNLHPRWLDHPPDVPPPFHGCSCGLYLVDHMEQITNAPSTLYGSSLQGAKGLQEGKVCAVVGSCRLWGRMTRHEHGWRAQYAYPERLFILKPDNSPDPLAGPSDNEFDETRRLNLIAWKLDLEEAYGVPVGFCEKKDFENLGRALED